MSRLINGKAATLAILLGASFSLGACRDQEQDRFTIYEPGVYQGQPDTQLSEAQMTALRNRATMQMGGTIGTGPGGMVTGDVRPPE